MSGRVANCPSCGGPVEFRAATSLLSVCPYCSSAVARTGGDVGALELLGKVAPLAALGSPLSLGARGRHGKLGFTLVGRLQLDWGAGPWNEWYAAFEDGTWAWIAEAQGRVYVTVAKPLGGLPGWESVRVGARFEAGRLALTVVERRRARFVAAEGELPSVIVPGAELRYADLEGPDALFGTLDYGDGSEPPTLYLGKQLRYEDLFDAGALRDRPAERAAGSEAMSCPNCGAGVELRAPDEAQRVTCGTCGSLLDAGAGTKLHLLSAAKPKGPEPTLPLGAKGSFDGRSWVIYAHLRRSVTVEGTKYFWEEYLLRNDARGWRWLVVSDGHWSWVEPVHAGEVGRQGRAGVTLRETSFRPFQTASAQVESIRGELYWKVAVGERVGVADWVAPPLVLSQESSAEEVSWSLGRYLEPREVEAAFKLERPLPRPRGVGANQPNPWATRLRASALAAGAVTLLLFLAALVLGAASKDHVVLDQSFTLTPKAAGATSAVAVQTELFTVAARSNLAVRLDAAVQGSWLYAAGQLVSQDGHPPRPFGLSLRAYTDLTPAERTVYLGAVAPGRYVLSLEPEWGGATAAPTSMRVEAREDVYTNAHLEVAVLVVWLLPAFALLRRYRFEKDRWAESDHA